MSQFNQTLVYKDASGIFVRHTIKSQVATCERKKNLSPLILNIGCAFLKGVISPTGPKNWFLEQNLTQALCIKHKLYTVYE